MEWLKILAIVAVFFIIMMVISGCTTLTGSNRDVRTFSVDSEGCEQLDIYVNKHRLDKGVSESKGTISESTTIGK